MMIDKRTAQKKAAGPITSGENLRTSIMSADLLAGSA
jgi:hypothetical protein